MILSFSGPSQISDKFLVFSRNCIFFQDIHSRSKTGGVSRYLARALNDSVYSILIERFSLSLVYSKRSTLLVSSFSLSFVALKTRFEPLKLRFGLIFLSSPQFTPVYPHILAGSLISSPASFLSQRFGWPAFSRWRLLIGCQIQASLSLEEKIFVDVSPLATRFCVHEASLATVSFHSRSSAPPNRSNLRKNIRKNR